MSNKQKTPTQVGTHQKSVPCTDSTSCGQPNTFVLFNVISSGKFQTTLAMLPGRTDATCVIPSSTPATTCEVQPRFTSNVSDFNKCSKRALDRTVRTLNDDCTKKMGNNQKGAWAIYVHLLGGNCIERSLQIEFNLTCQSGPLQKLQ